MLKPIDEKRLGLINALKIDSLMKWDDDEWIGTANEAEFHVVIIFKSQLVQVGIAEREYEYRQSIKPLLVWKNPLKGTRPNIKEILDNLGFIYDDDEIWDDCVA